MSWKNSWGFKPADIGKGIWRIGEPVEGVEETNFEYHHWNVQEDENGYR